MAEYIEREAVTAAILNLKSALNTGIARRNLTQKDIMRVIAEFPAADVAPKVRCKDCKNCEIIFPEKEIGKEPRQAWICKVFKCGCKPDDFCSYGKRRAENG